MATSQRVARGWHLLTTVVAAGAVGFQLALVLGGASTLSTGASRPDLATELVRFVSYFTIVCNLLVLVTSAATVRGLPDTRAWRAARLSAVVGITVTGVVHFVLLRPLLDLHGASSVADKLLHMVVPALAVAGWLAFGPRERVRREDLLPSLLFPVLWLAYTLVRGAFVGWYPYPFVDVDRHGYGVVALSCVGVAVLFLALSAVARWVDPRLPGERLSAASSGTTPRPPTGRT